MCVCMFVHLSVYERVCVCVCPLVSMGASKRDPTSEEEHRGETEDCVRWLLCEVILINSRECLAESDVP